MIRSLAVVVALTCSGWAAAPDARTVAGPVAGPVATLVPTPAPHVAAQRTAQQVTGVLVISLDGLNPAALRKLGREGTPHLHRFRRAGASTLNARTERELTLTLPNHTGMVTGRRIDRRHGGHGVTWNDDRTSPSTVQEAAGHPVGSVFTVVDAAGGSTALFASKTKFSLWQRSWPDAIDRTVIETDNAALVGDLVSDLATTQRSLRFLHLSLPDVAGHAHGFMSAPYLRAVRRVDRLVGRAVRAVRSDDALRTSTAIILTSDHGGRGWAHDDRTAYANYRVAFMVRGPGVARGADLYALNPDYANPRRRRTTYAADRQPVRNGDVADLALDLLGLPAVPDSEHDAAQDLDVR